MRKTAVHACIIAAYALVLAVPFLDKAFHIDAYPYITGGRILAAGGFDLGEIARKTTLGFEGRLIEADAVTHPPLFHAVTGLVVSVFEKPYEKKLHLVTLFFSLLCAMGIYLLGKRLTEDPLLCSLLLLSFPGYLVISHNVTADLPFTAMFLLAAALYLNAMEKNSRGSFVISGLSAAAAFLISYQGLFLIPFFMLYPVFTSKRRNFYTEIPWIVPLIVCASWCFFIFGANGAFAISKAMQATVNNPLLDFAHHLKKFIYNTAVIGEVTVFPLGIFIVFGAENRRSLFFLFTSSAAVFLLSLLYAQDYTALNRMLLVLSVSAGLLVTWHFAGLLVNGISKNKNGVDIFLGIWYLGFMCAATVFLPYGSVRYMLPVFPAVVISFVRSPGTRGRVFLYGMVFLTAVTGLLVAKSDYDYVAVYRAFAGSLGKEPAVQNRKVWFSGEWGYRYYMEEQGFGYILKDRPEQDDGDIVVVAGMPSYAGLDPLLLKKLDITKSFVYMHDSPIQTSSFETHGCLYSDWDGRTPLSFSFGKGQKERFHIFRVSEPGFFLENFEAAAVNQPGGIKDSRVKIDLISVNNEPAAVIFEHPPASIRYDNVAVGKKYLEFSAGIDEKCWNREGDGTEFALFIGRAGSGEIRKSVFSVYIDPKNKVSDRKWHRYELDLSEYYKDKVDIELVTKPGPSGNEDWDHAGWARIRFIDRK
ncbi:MAG: glycosyltransferase family 39 protein [Elusimicrobia bacterium]|nr:glycosyltransferase family 39 protein [Elusimicrobiota bacterium]